MDSARRARLLAKFNCNPPADPGSIRQLERESGFRLPDSYAGFLQQANGGEGFVGDAYVILWALGELRDMNKAYQVAEYAPGLFLFGSDGGGEAFAFDTRSDAKAIVSVPFVGMDLQAARPLASNFQSLLEKVSECRPSTMPRPNDNPANRLQNCAGKEIFEVHPAVLGGSPTDPANKVALTRQQHIEAVRYWNRVIRDVRNSRTVRQ